MVFCLLFHSRFAVEAQRQFNGVEQDLVIDRLAEIGGGLAGQSPGACLIGIMAGDDHDGHTELHEPGLNLEAVHDRHVQIQHHAIGPVRRKGFKKLAAGGK